MLLSLRGTPVLYQGDEIGMANVAVAHEDMRDPLGVRFYPYYEGRDAGRTPMQWSDRPGGGFTDAARPWLPLGDVAAANVAAQRDDPGSVLTLCHDLIAFRRSHPAFSTGDTDDAGDTRAAPGRGRAARTPRGRPQHVGGGARPSRLCPAPIQICTDRARDLEAVGDELRLAPFDGRDPRAPLGSGRHPHHNGGKNCMERLTDKVAIVTGGGGGIGGATARALAREDASVLVVDIDQAAAELVAQGITEAGGRAVAFQADLSDEAQVVATIAAATSTLRPPGHPAQQRGADRLGFPDP